MSVVGSQSSRGSYPSRQRRIGPAPLASFEDLPTDEQSSSEDERPPTSQVAAGVCPQISFLITDENDSQLEPVLVVETSLSAGNEPHREQNHDHSWLTSPQVKENKRKGSWTDIFSLRKSPIKTRERKFSLFNFKFFSKDSRNDSESELRDLGSTSWLASASPGARSAGRVEPERSSTSSRASTEQVSASSDLTPTNPESKSFSTSSVTETVVLIERHTPRPDDDTATIVESRSDSTCSLASGHGECCCDTPASETDDCEECRRCERVSVTCHCENDTDCCNVADNEDNDEDTERNLVSDDGELECLLTHDQFLEPSSHLSVEPPFRPIRVSTESKTPSERLKTSPIERPHSITPINVNSFEAYINQFTPDDVDHGDRLTIKLPGLQPNQRNRFTRKSNPYIWQEFCERGLKSPQVLRKRANSCFPEINQNYYLSDTLEAVCSAENLTPITPIKDLDGAQDRFDDNFWDYLNRAKAAEMAGPDESVIKVALNSLRTLQTSCSCDCNSSFTSTTAYNVTCSELSSCSEGETTTELSATETHYKSECNEDQPLVSPCDCVCHRTHPMHQFSLGADLSTSLGMSRANECSSAVYDNRNTEDDDLSQLSSSTLSSSSSTASSTSQSVRLLDTSPNM